MSGTMRLNGTVAQSTGGNDQLTLTVAFDSYADTEAITFATGEAPLDLSLSVSTTPPDNTMSGSLSGDLEVSGEVDDTGTLDLRLSSDLSDDDADPAHVCTRVTGTVSVGGESLDVDLVVPLDLAEDQAEVCAGL